MISRSSDPLTVGALCLEHCILNADEEGYVATALSEVGMALYNLRESTSTSSLQDPCVIQVRYPYR